VSEAPVVVVGAGPAGLSAAVVLARHGIEVVLVERRSDLSSLPRATAISTRSMELLRSWGLEDEVRAGGTEVEWLQWHCRTLALAGSGHGTPTGLPSRDQAAMVSPTTPACVPQDHLEPVLLDHLRSLGTARVMLGTEVTQVENRPDRIQVALRDVADGSSRVLEARYLIAADGAHSTVRQALGIEMRGPDRLLEAVSTLFRAPLSELVGPHRYGLYAVSQTEAEGVFLPAGRGNRWLYAVMKPEADVTGAAMEHRIRLGAGVAGLRPRIERIGGFSFAAQMAESFRAGNAFLAGDAAHRVTPRGGTGMNTAIHAATTSAGSLPGCCAGGPVRSCSTPTRPSDGRRPSTTSSGRPTRAERRARPSESSRPTWAGGSSTCGPAARASVSPRSTCSARA
jgi:putative polyketide hydroxylase